jgi:hypothetical protein
MDNLHEKSKRQLYFPSIRRGLGESLFQIDTQTETSQFMQQYIK